MNEANQTIVGSYALADCTLPDGTVVKRAVQKAINKHGIVVWEFVDEKVAAAEARFSDTTTVPSNYQPVTTNVLTQNQPSSADCDTKGHVIAHLSMSLGTIERILAQGALDTDKYEHLKRHTSHADTLRCLCIIAGGQWLKVVGLIPRPN